MRRTFTCLACVVTFGALGTSAGAAILIDGFLDDTPDLVAPGSPSSDITENIDGGIIDREIVVEASGAFSIVTTVLDGFLVIDAGGATAGSASAELEYLGFVFDLGANTFFAFTTEKITGAPVLGLILQDATAGQISGGVQLNPSDTGQSFFLDLTTFSGYTPGFGSQVNSVLVVIGDADQDFFVQGVSFQFTAVPEPSSAALVACTAMLMARRRRRSAV